MVKNHLLYDFKTDGFGTLRAVSIEEITDVWILIEIPITAKHYKIYIESYHKEFDDLTYENIKEYLQTNNLPVKNIESNKECYVTDINK